MVTRVYAFFLLFGWLSACQSPQGVPTATVAGFVQAMPATLSPTTTAAPSPTATSAGSVRAVRPTNLPLPPTETATAATTTPPPSPTAVPTMTPSPLLLPSAPPPSCPDPPPSKPDYAHNLLAAQAWPTPDTAVPTFHFWLADPVTGGRKPLENGYYPYGWDGDGRFLLHNGADMPKERGTLVTAVAAGTVVVAGSDVAEWYGWRCDWYGQLVVLELDEQWQGQSLFVLYGHVQQIQVEVGQHVQQGEAIAEIGVEGVSSVPHLHLEIRVGSNGFADTQNPMLWLQPLPGTGLVAGRLMDGAGRPWQGTRLTLIEAADDGPRYLYTFTYLDDPQHVIHPDVALAENFVFADLQPGNYTLFASVGGVEYRVPLLVNAGEVTAVEIVAEGSE